MPPTLRLFSAVLLIGICGCMPGQIIWSPDGHRAAYLPELGEEAYVIDDTGKVLANLGRSLGGFAWSADSRMLIFASVAEARTPRSVEERGRWLERSLPGGFHRTDRFEELLGRNHHIVVSAWRDDGQTRQLFTTRRFVPLYMDISPDQDWLGVLAAIEFKHQDETTQLPALFVWSFRRDRLYVLSDLCAPTFCFTGSNRLAYVPWRIKDKKSMRLELVEVTLDERRSRLARKHLADALVPSGGWLCAAADDIIFTGLPHGPHVDRNELFDASPKKPMALCRFSRSTGQVEQITSNVSINLSISPDRTRVLFTQLPPDDDEQADEKLCVLTLSDNKVYPIGGDAVGRTCEAMLPIWRSDDTISFANTSAATTSPVLKDNARYYELTIYRLNERWELTPVRRLSASWPLELKPRIREKGFKTVPATRPAR